MNIAVIGDTSFIAHYKLVAMRRTYYIKREYKDEI